MATAATAGQYRLLYGNTKICNFRCAGAVLWGTPVALHASLGTITQAGDPGGAAVVYPGIAAATGASGETIPVYIDGVFEATTDGDYIEGDVMYIEDAGTIGDGEELDVSIGILVNSNPASGGVAHFVLISSLFDATTTHAA